MLVLGNEIIYFACRKNQIFSVYTYNQATCPAYIYILGKKLYQFCEDRMNGLEVMADKLSANQEPPAYLNMYRLTRKMNLSEISW